MAEDILSNANFTITLLPGEISVGRILPDGLKSCAWPLLKAVLGGAEDDTAGFFSLTQEATELTLLMDERCRSAFDEAAGVAAIEYAPHRWRVLELHLGSLAWEVPGLVCFLATLMAESRVSILNLSSNDRDFLLVQESDIASATRVIQERLQHDAVGLKDAISEKAMVRRSGTFGAFDVGELNGEIELAEVSPEATAASGEHGSSAVAGAAPAAATEAGAGAAQLASGGGSLRLAKSDGSAGGGAAASSASSNPGSNGGSFRSLRRGLSESETEQPFDSDSLHIKVLPTTLVVVRLQRSMLQASTHALVHRILFAPPSGQRCFWSYTQSDDEISLIIDEKSLALFPEEAIVGSSTRWRPLRLCGKSFAFDETGVVSAMFAPYEEGMPLLNISTFSTNISLVEEGDLERALESFEVPVVHDGDLS